MASSPDPVTLPEPSRRSRTGGRPTKSQTAQLNEDLREAALARFLEYGFEATSVAAIASDAGTTKAALYGRFPDKESLFVEVVGWALGRSDWPAPAPPLPDVVDLEGSLRSIAEASVQRATDPLIVSLTRTVAAQAGRFPELAKQVFAASWSTKAFLVLLLQHHAATGTIVADEPEILADNFLALIAAGPAYHAALGVLSEASTRLRDTEGAIELFLRGALAR